LTGVGNWFGDFSYQKCSSTNLARFRDARSMKSIWQGRRKTERGQKVGKVRSFQLGT